MATPSTTLSTTPDPSPARPARASLLDALATKWRIVPVLLALAAIWTIFTIQNPVFLSSRNMTNLAEQIAVTSIVALGLVFVLLVGEIDLSVAGLSAVCGGVVGVLVVNHGVPFAAALVVAVGAGGAFGLVQGAVIMYFGAPAFIVTLGSSLMLQGVLLVLLPSDSGLVPLAGTAVQTVSQYDLPPGLSYSLAALASLVVLAIGWHAHADRVRNGLPSTLGRSLRTGLLVLVLSFAVVTVFNNYQGVPASIALLAGLLALFSWVITQTRFGVWLYAIGGNAEAARRVGIPVKRMKVGAFMILGMLTAVGGVVAASRVLGVSPASADQSLLLEAIAAAVIGGTSLFGGRGNIWAAVIGALVIGSIANGMFLVNASTELRLLVQGGVLVIAVVVDAAVARSSRSVKR